MVYSVTQEGLAVSYILRKEVKQMRLTLTLHIGTYTVSFVVIVKERNRHSAQ